MVHGAFSANNVEWFKENDALLYQANQTNLHITLAWAWHSSASTPISQPPPFTTQPNLYKPKLLIYVCMSVLMRVKRFPESSLKKTAIKLDIAQAICVLPIFISFNNMCPCVGFFSLIYGAFIFFFAFISVPFLFFLFSFLASYVLFGILTLFDILVLSGGIKYVKVKVYQMSQRECRVAKMMSNIVYWLQRKWWEAKADWVIDTMGSWDAHASKNKSYSFF